MDVAEAGARSVYRFIERTAEPVDKGFRWKTIDYDNQPHHDYNLFNGSGGISLFLAEYYRQTDCGAALDLAIGANRWCWQEDPYFSRGIHFGQTGVGMASLHLSQVAQHSEFLDNCAENAKIIMREDPGPFTDLLSGAASNGLYLIRLWQATHDNRYLSGAVRCGEWSSGNLERDDRGCHCLARPDGEFGKLPFTGVAHGIAGVAHFFLLLYEATGEREWAGFAEEILETLLKEAIPDKGGLNWSPLLGEKELNRCQWSHGAAGIGLVFLKYHELLDKPSYFDVAQLCGRTTHAYGDFRSNITQCIGLSGCGELFLELYRVSNDQCWLDYAAEFAQLACRHKEELPEGDAWPTDAPGLYSADFMYGAAGLGHYFLRLQSSGCIAMPLM